MIEKTGSSSQFPIMSVKDFSSGRRFIISSFVIICFLCLLASINEIRFETVLAIGKSAFSSTSYYLQPNSTSSSAAPIPQNPPSSPDDLRILLGILTLPDHYERRHFLRMIYRTQSPPSAQVDLKFVFCNLTKEDQKPLISLEIMSYNDIIILNCTENMNKGKTYSYFSALPEIFNSTDNQTPYPPYHYVVKADDDTYFRLDKLVESLIPLPREDLYYGFVIPCESMDPFKLYMAGLGYLLSWDLVEWIRESDIPKGHLVGPEDRVLGEWIRWGKRGKNRYNAKWSIYNYPDPPNKCTHELWNGTIALHHLKNQKRWIHALNYFNVTKDLKNSKMYHID